MSWCCKAAFFRTGKRKTQSFAVFASVNSVSMDLWHNGVNLFAGCKPTFVADPSPLYSALSYVARPGRSSSTLQIVPHKSLRVCWWIDEGISLVNRADVRKLTPNLAGTRKCQTQWFDWNKIWLTASGWVYPVFRNIQCLHTYITLLRGSTSLGGALESVI